MEKVFVGGPRGQLQQNDHALNHPESTARLAAQFLPERFLLLYVVVDWTVPETVLKLALTSNS